MNKSKTDCKPNKASDHKFLPHVQIVEDKLQQKDKK